MYRCIILYNDKISFSKIYPVGAIIITTVAYANSAAVVAVYGGTTWTEVGNGYFLKAVGTGGSAGSTANAGNTGSTTLTAAQSGVPAHSHGFTNPSYSAAAVGDHQHVGLTFDMVVYSNGRSGVNYLTTAGNTAIGYRNADEIGTGSAGGHSHTISLASAGSVSNNTATAASSGHTHTAGNPASYGVHIWKRTA